MWPVDACTSLKYKGENYKVEPNYLIEHLWKQKKEHNDKDMWPGASGTLDMSITYWMYLNGQRKGNTQGALKEQWLVTIENFDNEQSAKT